MDGGSLWVEEGPTLSSGENSKWHLSRTEATPPLQHMGTDVRHTSLRVAHAPYIVPLTKQF